ncbi:hypothetical protein AN928_30690 [Pseudomonas aeruginosa]|nr:hypothetical protein HW09_19120 [Pseudomonas aeruginosa]ESR71440.1 hypothetical protein T266_09645 [Pseudomonas aeruginosa VRFPA05]KHE61015.1 hypothetical protein D480_0216795 [Pseudomonas aeruginosa]KJC22804.1 hypothetical protein TO65_01160 [Pseudomonas aeruginosa]KWZ64627.1 hypothetical protein AKG06_30605 [Pseudomonas aeruginosa]
MPRLGRVIDLAEALRLADSPQLPLQHLVQSTTFEAAGSAVSRAITSGSTATRPESVRAG